MDGARTRRLRTSFRRQDNEEDSCSPPWRSQPSAPPRRPSPPISARAPYYNKAPAYAAPLYNWTGFYIGAHVGGAFSSDNNFNGLVHRQQRQRPLRSAACRPAPTGSSRRTGWSAPKASTAGSAGNVGAVFPGGFAYTNNQRGLGSITGRVGYTWGPGLLYVKGGYAYSDNNETRDARRRAGRVRDRSATTRNGYTVGAGVEYMFAPNWSAKAEYQYYNFGRRPLHRAGRAGADRQLHHRRPCLQGRRQLSLQLGRPGGRAVLIRASQPRSCGKAGVTPAFLLLLAFPDETCSSAKIAQTPISRFC